MVYSPTAWANLRARGFFIAALFCLISLGGTVVLAQLMPLADMCNPGLPFMTGLFSLIISVSLAVTTLIDVSDEPAERLY